VIIYEIICLILVYARARVCA